MTSDPIIIVEPIANGPQVKTFKKWVAKNDNTPADRFASTAVKGRSV